MWRWTLFFSLLTFYGQSSSQPLSDDNENVRQSRQLDFGDNCCPCPGAGPLFDAQETSISSGDGSYALARNVDDCPCRSRSSDSDGASSILMPTLTRSYGANVRPIEKKEETKPLLHPEVDLASSVLQTLRDATEEEYQDALARDAARNIAKAADETIFGDPVPEASTGNIVTIIVNPKHADSLEDVIPQESHVQESRCIHAPLDNTGSNLSKIRVASKPPYLLREIFGLPRISKPAESLHRNLLDMDTSVGASNIQERVSQVDGTVENNDILGIKKYAPMIKFEADSKTDGDNAKSIKKVPNFNLPSMKNKLKDFIPNRSAFESTDKVNSLSFKPKMKINTSLLKVKDRNNEDLSLSPDNIREQLKENFFQTKSHLENILRTNRPGGLKTLLKLKDVEIIPLKDLVPKSSSFNRPKYALPGMFNEGNDKILDSNNVKPKNVAKNTEIIENTHKSKKNEIIDHEVSPSTLIEQINEDDCHKEALKTATIDDEDTKNNIALTEITDTVPSPSEVQSSVSDIGQDLTNDVIGDHNENCNFETLPVTEPNISNSMEDFFYGESQDNNEGETNKEPSEKNASKEDDTKINSSNVNCDNNINDAFIIADFSTNVNDAFKPNNTVLENPKDSLENENIETEVSSNTEVLVNNAAKTLNNLVKPHLLDVTNIKENIKKHFENLKNLKPSPKIIFDSDTQNSTRIIENEEIPSGNLDSDCYNVDSIQVTTVAPDSCEDNLNANNETSNTVSMQDLQKISDSMLQEEQERNSKTEYCDGTSQEATNSKIPVEENSTEEKSMDSENSANTQNEIIIDPQNVVVVGDENTNDMENTCPGNLILPKQLIEPQPDSNTGASELVTNSVLIDSSPLAREVVQPFGNDLSVLSPIPTLDEIKDRLSNLFDKTAQDVDELTPLGLDPIIDQSDILGSTMSSDASVPNFHTRLPPLELNDINLDILQLKPQSDLLSSIPKLDLLQASKTKNLLPTDLKIKPIKLQSTLKNKNNLLDTSIVLSRNSPNLMKKQILKNENNIRRPAASLRNSLDYNKRIGDLLDPENTLRSMQRTLQSTFEGVTKKSSKFSTNGLLESISRNHEDVSDKLRALHVDFNDRIETMRNNLLDIPTFGNSGLRNSKPSAKSFSTFSKQNKDKNKSLKSGPPLSSRKESKKTLQPQRLEQQRRARIGSPQRLPNEKLKMPAAASVPVPRTMEVPELKATVIKSSGLALQRAPALNRNNEVSQEPSLASWPASKNIPITNTRLGKQMNPFKNSKITVTFSTTPRPSIPNEIQSGKLSTASSRLLTSNLRRNIPRPGQNRDHYGSPSELKHLITSPTITSQGNQLNPENNDKIKASGRENTEVLSTMGKDLQSWPKVSESAFLSKVKEAVKARLSKDNTPLKLKQTADQSTTNFRAENSNIDMIRSASENFDVLEKHPLKENVSYKCTMVCTKE